MKSTLSSCAASLWNAVKAPVIRCECDRRYGLYKSKNSLCPAASFDTRRDSDIPLYKLIAIVGIVIAICIVMKKMTSRKARRRICVCADTKDGN